MEQCTVMSKNAIYLKDAKCNLKDYNKKREEQKKCYLMPSRFRNI